MAATVSGTGGQFQLKKIEHIVVWIPVAVALPFAAWQTQPSKDRSRQGKKIHLPSRLDF
jgi:hypothetical protein